MTLREWLASPLYHNRPLPTVIQRLAELIRVNGGLKVSGWGCISGDGLYGRSGLGQAEALDLIHFDGILTGFRLVGQSDAEFVSIIEAEWQRVEQLRQAEIQALTTVQ